MNIEEIKDIWANEKTEKIPEISLQKQKEIKLPLEKIRKNMKLEFWLGILIFPLIVFLYADKFSGVYQNTEAILLLFTTLMVSGYYFVKFYSLYKKLNTQNFSTYHHLLDLRYELVLNSELYKSHYLSYAPIYLCLYTMLYSERGTLFSLILIIVSCFFSFILLYILGKFWMQEMYGKHIQKISLLVSELNDEEDDFKYNRSILSLQTNLRFLPKIRRFCHEKFGKYGNLFYGLMIAFIITALILIIAFIIGFVIGYTGMYYNATKL